MKQVGINDTEMKKDGETFLMHAVNELQADTVESLLRSYDIPVLKKHRETGSYLNIVTGMNIYGVDLYVPVKLHKTAVALVRTRKRHDDGQDVEIQQVEDEFRRKRLIRIWIIIGIFYLPVLAALLIKALQ